jgi:hypothetical protein
LGTGVREGSPEVAAHSGARRPMMLNGGRPKGRRRESVDMPGRSRALV